MPYRVQCACGCRFGIKEGFTGRTVACPRCKAPHPVPQPAPQDAPRPAQAAPRPVPQPPPQPIADGPALLALEPIERAPAPVPRRTCPQCREVSPVGTETCPSCGFDFEAGKKLRERARSIAREEEERPPGFLQLGAGMLFHPFSTMESLLYHAGHPPLMAKILVFFLATVPAEGWLVANGKTDHLLQGTLMVLVQFVVSAACILLAGRVLGEGGTFLGAIVALAFARSFVFVAAGGILVAMWVGAAPMSAIAAFLLVLAIVGLVLNVLTIMAIFSCEAMTAFGIGMVAGALQRLAMMFIPLR